ncbi:hypothetical protein POX_a00211 [Penicillium oxalicum]|uniref:Uncharacterized protein n=1 Tax=Penicillium oxalicum (strain 114-2 / CGMCC 5302) TaxID=933388 RepID=S8BHW8_PENO1|nr:hypothetical protein POX_a00211 [Penicillium oxalicum]EPS34822.1 hypothetical protein PDE_09786 [Penicillium oxalicum 114-2]KAI2793629.1 hypothetical protein POX_a00211 [Penicillium oxalicum]
MTTLWQELFAAGAYGCKLTILGAQFELQAQQLKLRLNCLKDGRSSPGPELSKMAIARGKRILTLDQGVDLTIRLAAARLMVTQIIAGSWWLLVMYSVSQQEVSRAHHAACALV